jgi:hypothetical protein
MQKLKMILYVLIFSCVLWGKTEFLDIYYLFHASVGWILPLHEPVDNDLVTLSPPYALQQSCPRKPQFRSVGSLGDRIKILMSWLPGFGSGVEIPLNKGQEDFGDGPSAKCRLEIRTVDLERHIIVRWRKHVTFARARTAQCAGVRVSLHGTECTVDAINSLRS